MIRSLLTLLMILFTATGLIAQVDPDSLFAAARDAVFQQEDRERAIALCEEALKIAPGYHDIRIFKGRCHAWGGDYLLAEEELRQVLQEDPNSLDGRVALLDVYLWSDRLPELVETARLGLEQSPSEVEYLYRLAVGLTEQEENREALLTLESLLRIAPAHEKGYQLYRTLRKASRSHKVSLGYSHEALAATETAWQALVLEPTMDPWKLLTLEYQQDLARGPVILRWSQANRFGSSGGQLELDAYPRLRPGTYAYVSLGVASSALFPDARAGAEIYQALPRDLEGALGFRYLHVSTGDVTVLTGALAKYWRQYWFNFRVFVTPQDVSYSRAWSFATRRYLSRSDSYLELSLGSGESPDQALGAEEVEFLGARRLAFTAQYRVASGTWMRGGFSLANQEIQPDRYRGVSGINLTIVQRF